MKDQTFHENWIEQRKREGAKYPAYVENCLECVHFCSSDCLVYGFKEMNPEIKNCSKE